MKTCCGYASAVWHHGWHGQTTMITCTKHVISVKMSRCDAMQNKKQTTIGKCAKLHSVQCQHHGACGSTTAKNIKSPNCTCTMTWNAIFQCLDEYLDLTHSIMQREPLCVKIRRVQSCNVIPQQNVKCDMTCHDSHSSNISSLVNAKTLWRKHKKKTMHSDSFCMYETWRLQKNANSKNKQTWMRITF